MNWLKRFYNQNRKKIWKYAVIVAMIIIVIQILNTLTKNSNKNNSSSNNTTAVIDKSNYSVISGSKIDKDTHANTEEMIKEFVNYCNEGNIESAYNLISEDCKETVFFGNVENFKAIYCSKIFTSKKSYDIQAWTGTTYKVNYFDDLLATGKSLSDSSTVEDYITLVIENNEKKLNINSYIKKEEINKSATNKGITVLVKNKKIFLNNEIYTINVTNNTENDILMDTQQNSKSMYITIEKGSNAYAYNYELNETSLVVNKNMTKDLEIKFANSYNTKREVKSLTLSNIVMNYSEYLSNNRQALNTTKIEVNL